MAPVSAPEVFQSLKGRWGVGMLALAVVVAIIWGFNPSKEDGGVGI